MAHSVQYYFCFQVINGLKTGNDALKRVHDVLSIDEIEQILDETKEGIEKQREIDAVISGELTQEDDDAVEAELDAILDVKDNLPELPTDQLPQAPEELEEKPRKARDGPQKVAIEA